MNRTSADHLVFGLAADATLSDLKRAYRRAALALHPDQNDDPTAAARFRELTDAFRRLETKLEPSLPKQRTLQDRAAWFVTDAQNLLKRWPAARWSTPVDGLPAAVWLTSALEVLSRLWPHAGPLPSGATPAELEECLKLWVDHLRLHPLGKLAKRVSLPLSEALDAAEARLKALTRPKRSRS